MMSNPALDQILLGDCLAILPTLPPASVDMVFADPPYNLQLTQELWRPNLTLVDAVDEDWDQFENFTAYDAFTRAWLGAVRDVMKPTATIWVSGTYHNIFRVGSIMQDLGFWLLNTVTWFKPNAMPNFRGTRLKNDVEFLIWAKRDEDGRYTFDHHQMKQFNDGKQLGSVENPGMQRAERLRDANGDKLHPTQNPRSCSNVIRSSRPGDVILDPFLIGHDGSRARRLHRHWIGIEQNEVYVRAARERVAGVQPLADPPADRRRGAQTAARAVPRPARTGLSQAGPGALPGAVRPGGGHSR